MVMFMRIWRLSIRTGAFLFTLVISCYCCWRFEVRCGEGLYSIVDLDDMGLPHTDTF